MRTPEAVAAFAQHLADVNEQRRKARLRKALRGVPGEPERDRRGGRIGQDRATEITPRERGIGTAHKAPSERF